uniref:Uncharacterized protein n=1 Tax=Gracilaria robusta TaxID=38400 RepID=O46322_9FLOR|nr:ORF1 [Gracilaria robusta]
MNHIYINSEIKRINNIILQSEVSKQYFIYKSKSIVSNSASEDDWQYCLLILQYINPNDNIQIISKLLESFLKFDRYRDKFSKNYNYLYTTIMKSIIFSMQSGNLGCYYNCSSNIEHKLIQPLDKHYNNNNLIRVSCSAESVLKISNFLSMLDKSSYSNSFLDYAYFYKLDDNCSVKISMFGGLLNYFDLMIFLKILYIYKSVSHLFSDGILDINFSDFDFMLSNNGSNRRKYVNSLEKLSKVHLNTSVHIRIPLLMPLNCPQTRFILSQVHLMTFERLSTSSSTKYTTCILSKPLLKMFKLSDDYSIVNWGSLLNLPNSQVRLLYFYFCLNVKASKYFTTFTLDALLDKLYTSCVYGSTVRWRRSNMRKMLQFIYDNRSKIIDFDFHLVFDFTQSKNIISIKVRRVRVLSR